VGRNTIALIYYYITMTLTELKARAYDLIAQSELIQQELQKVNAEIRARMEQEVVENK
jgi:hypothetical protein